MKFALLGADARAVELAEAIAASRAHTLVALADCQDSPWAAELDRLAPRPVRLDQWESLLDGELVDAVIVCPHPDEDRRAEQLRKLAQAAVPTLVGFPIFSSMILYYEIDMIRREAGGVLLPDLPDRWHPAIVELKRLVADRAVPSLGQIEQLICERQMSDRSRNAVVAQFARDADLLKAITGEVSQIHAMGADRQTGAFGALSVQMSGPSGVLARWSVAPVQDRPLGRLTLVGSGGRAVVTMPADGSAWDFSITSPTGRLDLPTDSDWNSAQTAIDELTRAVAGEAVAPDWNDAARTAEVAETIDRSLRRGRTIDLYYEDRSEASAFKGTMVALGCGMLSLGVFVLVVVAVLEDFGKNWGQRIPFLAQWPYMLLGLLGLFLVLQFLLLAAGRKKPAARNPTGQTGRPD